VRLRALMARQPVRLITNRPIDSKFSPTRMPSSQPEECEVEEEELDPRVQQELEKLNGCTEEINKLETQLEDANCMFRTLLSDSTHQVLYFKFLVQWGCTTGDGATVAQSTKKKKKAEKIP
jgi:hypothetical protein